MFKKIAAFAAAAATLMFGLGVAVAPTAEAAAVNCSRVVVKYRSSGTCVTQAQTLLKKHGFYSRTVTGRADVATINAILNYQRAQRLPADGVVRASTWARLTRAVQVPTYTGIPESCRVGANVICVSKPQRKAFIYRNGKLVKSMAIRVGGFTDDKYGRYRVHNTVSGTYRVYRKHVNPYSQRYGAGAMPYSTMFNPNMYVHASAGFMQVGYAGSSHGCVNMSTTDAKWVYKNMPIGTKVVVF